MKEISKALLAFQKEMPSVKKGDDNPFFKSKYASLDSILPVVIPMLTKHGLTFTQIPTGENELKTIIIHPESGETIQGQFSMKPSKEDPQGRGAAITYARRFALVSMLGLNTEEDDDGNTASKKPSASPKTAQIDAQSAEGMVCDYCAEKALVSPKSGRLYCPNWKEHKANGDNHNIVKLGDKEFYDSLPENN